MNTKRILITTAILWLVAGSVPLAGETIQVMGSVDKDRVQVDEEVSLTIKILGTSRNVQAPRLPSFQGFDSFYTGRTSQFSFVNGKSSATVEFNYVLVPKVAGRFTLESVQIWIEGKSYQTQPLEIEVLGPQLQAPSAVGQFKPIPPTSPQNVPTIPTTPTAPAQASAPLTQPPAALPEVVDDENIFIQATVDKQNVYQNEQLLLVYTLYTRYDTRYEGFEEEPSVSGFWIEDFPLDRDLGRDTVTIHGKRYMKADVRKIALFPTSPAQYTIEPGTLKVSIREEPRTDSVFDEFFGDSFFSGSGFFGRRVERLLQPAPITINVRPLPEEGKPASFKGAVGVFQISASVDKNEVKQNEPVTLKLSITGEGNIETLSKPPVPQLTGFKVYDGDSSSELFKSDGTTIAGRKNFEEIFIPLEAGDVSIPPLEFSFFDPRRQTYQVLRTQPFPLKVIPSNEPVRLPAELEQKDAFKKEIRREGQDVRFIHEELPSKSAVKLQQLLYQALVVANLFAMALTGIGLYRRRNEEILSRDVKLRKRKLARTHAGRRLKLLKRLAEGRKPEDSELFVAEAEKLLSEYFSNKFDISSYNLTKEWLREKLSEMWGGEDELTKQVLAFYDLTGETRFGRGSILGDERRELLRLMEMVIHRLEKLR